MGPIFNSRARASSKEELLRTYKGPDNPKSFAKWVASNGQDIKLVFSSLSPEEAIVVLRCFDTPCKNNEVPFDDTNIATASKDGPWTNS